MQKQQRAKENLAYAALDEIPETNENALEIVGIVKNQNVISGYKLSDDRIVTKDEAIDMAKNGSIRHVGIAHNGDTIYLKSLPNGDSFDNLSNLPVIDPKSIENM